MSKEWPKVKSVYTDIIPICETLRQGTQEYENIIFVSFLPTSGSVFNKNWNQLDPFLR
jgi:hypothetical protein